MRMNLGLLTNKKDIDNGGNPRGLKVFDEDGLITVGSREIVEWLCHM